MFDVMNLPYLIKPTWETSKVLWHCLTKKATKIDIYFLVYKLFKTYFNTMKFQSWKGNNFLLSKFEISILNW